MAVPPMPDREGASDFTALGLPPRFAQALHDRGITEPLEVQRLAIPDALAGRDVCGRAPTGSGKTLAFALPLAAMLPSARSGHPTGLVLAPTRELAGQIASTLAPFARLRGLRVAAVYGGVGYGPQIAALQRGVDVVVACPGRLEDLLASRRVSLADVGIVVVDEADRMADMGFLPAVRRLLDATRPDRQTMLFSATLDGDVEVLVRRYQRDPVRHEVVTSGEDLERMTHRFVEVSRDERVAACVRLVAASGSTMIFVRTRHGADRLVKQLGRSGLVAAAIHGDRTQAQRERALGAFRAGTTGALVATDVAARGIHVDEVACVIHFDLPGSAKDYVHRSGRTARAGAEGLVVSLVTPEATVAATDLRRALGLGHGASVSTTSDTVRPAAVRPPRPRAAAHRRRKARAGAERRRTRA